MKKYTPFKMSGHTLPGPFKRKSPVKHDLPGGEAHVHNYDFDTDTPEDEFTRRDKRIYVRTKKNKKTKKTKPTNTSLIRGGVNRTPKKKKDTWYRDTRGDGTVVSRGLRNIGKWLGNIRLRGGGRGGYEMGPGGRGGW